MASWLKNQLAIFTLINIFKKYQSTADVLNAYLDHNYFSFFNWSPIISPNWKPDEDSS